MWGWRKTIYIVFTLLFSLCASLVEAEPFVVVLNHAPPYRIIEKTNQDLKFSGLYVDLLKELATRAGLEITFKVVPFKRALFLMRHGDGDLMLGPNKSNEREKYMYFLDENISRERKVFFSRPNGPFIQHYDDLYGHSIGVLLGAVYFNKFDKDPNLHKYHLNNYLEGLRMVTNQRLQLIILPEQLGDYLIRENHLTLQKSSFFVEGRPSYFAVSRKSPLLAQTQRLERILREIKQDGTMVKIFQRYSSNPPR